MAHFGRMASGKVEVDGLRVSRSVGFSGRMEECEGWSLGLGV